MAQILQRFFYGLVSGIAECLPISAQAHRMLYQKLFNFTPNDPWLTVSVLAGSFAAILFYYHRQIFHLLHENALEKASRHRKNHPADQRAIFSIRIIKTALIPLLLSLLLYGKAKEWITGLEILILMLLINAVILFIPRITRTGDKDSTTMSRLDSVLMGALGAFGIFPGISRLGCVAAISNIRGTKPTFAVDIAFMICLIPLGVILGISLFGAFLSQAVVSSAAFFGNILAICSSFCGGLFGIWLLRSIAVKSGIYVFSYYSFGAALSALALYMIV